MGTTPESLVGVMLVPRSVRLECVSKMSPTIDYGVVKYAKDMEGKHANPYHLRDCGYGFNWTRGLPISLAPAGRGHAAAEVG
jgi:hypothetical protein